MLGLPCVRPLRPDLRGEVDDPATLLRVEANNLPWAAHAAMLLGSFAEAVRGLETLSASSQQDLWAALRQDADAPPWCLSCDTSGHLTDKGPPAVDPLPGETRPPPPADGDVEMETEVEETGRTFYILRALEFRVAAADSCARAAGGGDGGPGVPFAAHVFTAEHVSLAQHCEDVAGGGGAAALCDAALLVELSAGVLQPAGETLYEAMNRLTPGGRALSWAASVPSPKTALYQGSLPLLVNSAGLTRLWGSNSGPVVPIVQILTKVLPQRCQSRNFKNIVNREAWRSMAFSHCMRLLLYCGLCGAYAHARVRPRLRRLCHLRRLVFYTDRVELFGEKPPPPPPKGVKRSKPAQDHHNYGWLTENTMLIFYAIKEFMVFTTGLCPAIRNHLCAISRWAEPPAAEADAEGDDDDGGGGGGGGRLYFEPFVRESMDEIRGLFESDGNFTRALQQLVARNKLANRLNYHVRQYSLVEFLAKALHDEYLPVIGLSAEACASSLDPGSVYAICTLVERTDARRPIDLRLVRALGLSTVGLSTVWRVFCLYRTFHQHTNASKALRLLYPADRALLSQYVHAVKRHCDQGYVSPISLAAAIDQRAVLIRRAGIHPMEQLEEDADTVYICASCMQVRSQCINSERDVDMSGVPNTYYDVGLDRMICKHRTAASRARGAADLEVDTALRGRRRARAASRGSNSNSDDGDGGDAGDDDDAGSESDADADVVLHAQEGGRATDARSLGHLLRDREDDGAVLAAGSVAATPGVLSCSADQINNSCSRAWWQAFDQLPRARPPPTHSENVYGSGHEPVAQLYFPRNYSARFCDRAPLIPVHLLGRRLTQRRKQYELCTQCAAPCLYNAARRRGGIFTCGECDRYGTDCQASTAGIATAAGVGGGGGLTELRAVARQHAMCLTPPPPAEAADGGPESADGAGAAVSARPTCAFCSNAQPARAQWNSYTVVDDDTLRRVSLSLCDAHDLQPNQRTVAHSRAADGAPIMRSALFAELLALPATIRRSAHMARLTGAKSTG